MGISNVKTSKDLSSAIYYMLNGKGHDGSSQRYVSTRFENLTLDGAIQQTKAVREHFNKDKNVHGLTFIFSFSDKEIHHQDRVQQEKMMDSLHEVMKERFPNRQLGLVGQIDGDGKKFHIHAFVNSPDLTTGKLLDGRVKLHEHSKEMLTEAMNKANIQDLNKDVQVKQAKKTNIAVQKIKSKNPNSYIWLEDLQNRISKALNDKSVTDTKQFEERLLNLGVTAKARKSNKTQTGYALSYKFRDENGKGRTVRAGRLGTDFQLENIHSVILNHRALLQAEKEEAERRQREEAGREYFQKQMSRLSEARRT
ncbi:TPA: relaxase/mobilization nuclease domain-containing protein, partial [Streptococcus suis]